MRHLAMLLGLAAVSVQAQTSTPATTPQPDVAILANVRARELRFDEVGTVKIDVAGQVNGKAAAVVSRTERQNLPDPVQPHVTYRDIGIRLTITSTLPDIETILDEALAAPAAAKPAATATKKKR